HGRGAGGGAGGARPPPACRAPRSGVAGRRHARAPRAMRYVGRENVRKLLEPLDGTAGLSVYAHGTARIGSRVFRPSFGLDHEGTYDDLHVRPLLDDIARDHVIAVLLVRLGGYAVGVFDG